jgi:hypothetical protein
MDVSAGLRIALLSSAAALILAPAAYAADAAAAKPAVATAE